MNTNQHLIKIDYFLFAKFLKQHICNQLENKTNNSNQNKLRGETRFNILANMNRGVICLYLCSLINSLVGIKNKGNFTSICKV